MLQRQTLVGSPLWMAPEVFFGQAYSFSADIFSLGVMLYEILERSLPEYNPEKHELTMPNDYKVSLLPIYFLSANAQRVYPSLEPRLRAKVHSARSECSP